MLPYLTGCDRHEVPYVITSDVEGRRLVPCKQSNLRVQAKRQSSFLVAEPLAIKPARIERYSDAFRQTQRK